MISKMITKVSWRLLHFLIEKAESHGVERRVGEIVSTLPFASLSDISRKTGTTKANASRVIKKLEAMDLVRKNEIGRCHMYSFNFLHPESRQLISIAARQKREEYGRKLNNLPVIIHSFLRSSMRKEYVGCIFFGSSVNQESFRDIDVFVATRGHVRAVNELKNKLGLIDSRVSPMFGTMKELEEGLSSSDMLYENVIRGVPFGDLDIPEILYERIFRVREEIVSRFVVGFREILSCIEFTEDEYRKKHLDSGVMNLAYSLLRYYGFEPKNDSEAINMLRDVLGERKPGSVKEAMGLMRKYAWLLDEEGKSYERR